ncbi:MAG: NAD(P)-dependent oxidoreductase [Rickettsiales bacterium]|nr:NAD(P)-dependent oxidoreductase [Rickettsiales bacterium]
MLFLGAGYCTEFLTPLIEKEFEIIGTHNRLPFKTKYHNFKIVKRYSFEQFLNEKNSILYNVTHILNSIPPNDDGDIPYCHIKKELIKLNSLKWIGYFSTTGVYGNHNGNWVNENSELKTKNKRSLNRITAENQYLKLFLEHNLPVHIFRLPGIYGPKRSIFERINTENLNFIKKKDQFFSRIHVEDIANALYLSIKKPTPGEIFNLTDDYPCPSDEVTEYAFELLKKKRPVFLKLNDSKVSEMTRSFYMENKKVSNKKFKDKLNWSPEKKNFKIGLNEIFKLLKN